MAEEQQVPVAPLHQGLQAEEGCVGDEGTGAWHQSGPPSEVVEELEGLVRQAPQEDE